MKYSSGKKLFSAIITFALLQASFIQVATAKPAPASKPATPEIEKVVSTKSSSGRYDLKVFVSIEKGKGKNKVTLTRISTSGKSCYVPVSKKSCVLKNLSTGKSVKIYARSKNKFGYGVASSPLVYKVGKNNWYRTNASASTINSQNQTANSTNLPVVEPIIIEPIKAGSVTMLAQNQFIYSINLSGINPETLTSVSFEIAPKADTYAKAISAKYSKNYMIEKNYLDASNKTVDVPVFGLYQDYANVVSLTVKSTNDYQTLTKQIVTPRYSDDRYLSPEKVLSRDPNVSLDFNAMLLKNWRTTKSPVIIDTDGEVRWIGNSNYVPNQGSIFNGNSIISGSGSSLVRQNLDGSTELIRDYALLENITNSGHHNYDLGKTGILIEVVQRIRKTIL